MNLQHLTVNISLDIANLNMVNISSLDFYIWQHLEDHQNMTQLHHLSSIPSVPITQLYKHMISSNEPITPFTSPTESIDDTASIWALFSHPGVYVMAIGSPILPELGIFCCCFLWCWPARLAHKPLQPGSIQYTIVDYNVEAAPIYRCDSKAKVYKTSWESWHAYGMRTYTDRESTEATDAVIRSCCMHIIGYNIQHPGNTIMYILSVVRFRIGLAVAPVYIDW